MMVCSWFRPLTPTKSDSFNSSDRCLGRIAVDVDSVALEKENADRLT
jgi:hypothetical protein